MRGIILACAALVSLGLQAQTLSRAPVEVSVIGFNAVLNNGRVIASWKRYKPDDFYEYVLIKSSSNESPVYPGDTTVLLTNSPGEVRFEDGKIAPGTWHYRLCIVTRFGDRWISPAVTVEIKPDDLRRVPPTAADFE